MQFKNKLSSNLGRMTILAKAPARKIVELIFIEKYRYNLHKTPVNIVNPKA